MTRRWVDLSLRTKSLVVIAIPMIPLLVSSALFVDSARRAHVAQDSVAHTLEVKAQTAIVLGSMIDAEAGVRGFLLTHADESLRVYENALAELQPAIVRLAKLVADNPTQIDHLRTVVALAKTRPLTSLLTHARTAGPSAPAPLALLAESRTTMAALRTEFAAMQDVEDLLLAARTTAATRAQERQVQVSVLGAILGLLGGVIGAIAFSAGVVSRIRLVGENATRLSQGEPLEALAPAADEVGQVSRRLDEAGTLLTRRVQELRATRDELESRAVALAAANEELEAFSYSVSHDLRAPLRHVTGFAALLQRNAGPQLDEQAQRYVSTIAGAAKKMGQLIDDLLAFSRMGRAALTKRRVRLDDIVREAQREISAGVEGREVTWSVGTLPEVGADPAMLRMALVNLLSNALKYTASRADARIEIGSSCGSNGETVVFVRDNGVGFDMAYGHKLFGVFQRLHSSSEFEGTGIGLANVRRIIQRHGGRTWAEGAVDGGATFYFSLPDEDCAA